MIDVIITSHNRPDKLIQTVNGWRQNVTLDYKLIITDDGSTDDVYDVIQELKPDIAIFNGQRRGLGANLNIGLSCSTSPCQFILQDDFVARFNLDEYLTRAILFLEAGVTDIVRFGTPLDVFRFYPDVYKNKTIQSRLDPYQITDIEDLRIVFAKQPGAWVYSDNPHIRKSTFAKRFGLYPTGLKMADTETQYRDKCNSLGLKSSWFRSFETDNPPFDHIGADCSNREHWNL